MTLKEFKDKFKDYPDSTEIVVYVSDGSYDYATSAYEDVGDDEGEKVIVIAGN